MVRECLLSKYKDLAVRAMDVIVADRQFRSKFGRTIDQIIAGADIENAFKASLGNLEIMPEIYKLTIRTETRFSH